MQACAYAPCSEPFTPKRANQRFCLKAKGKESCRYKYNHAHRRNDPHRCPYCTVMHDPEERAVLDALELLIATEASNQDDSESPLILYVEDLQAFLHHRRALLSAPESDPAELPFSLSEAAQMS
jgi:hypothetical protein